MPRRSAGRWARARAASYRERLDGFLLHEALAELWEFVGAANKAVDAEQPWVLAKAAKAGDGAAGDAAAGRAGRPHRGVPARRAGGGAVPARRPRRGCSPSSVTHTRTAPDGNGGPPILDELGWGAHAGETGRVGAPEPLFPRLDVETEGS